MLFSVFSVCVFAAENDKENLADSKKVLLIEDNAPWDSDANDVILTEINADYNKIKTSEFNAELLNHYGVVILANDQTTDTYNAYGSFTDELEAYVKRGGTVVYGACDEGWGGNGSLTSQLPGGVEKITKYTTRNYIEDASHPIVTGVLTDSTVLTDEDLYGNYCSHVYFIESTLPVGSNVILRDSDTNQPTLVEYPLGEGFVLASGLTWEFYQDNGSLYNYAFSLIAMDDYFSYAIQHYNSTIEFTVDNLGMKADYKYNDTYFNTSSYIYNHELAKASLGFAISAMVRDGQYKNPEAAKKLFDDLSYENYTPYNYTSVPTSDSIAFVMANKNIDETDTSIIAISIRGGGYEAEWGGNFRVGTGVNHEGFELARNQVLKALNTFLADNEEKILYKDNLKFWITGYSRSAATANLVSAELNKGPDNVSYCSNLSDYTYLSDDVFAYTFETPRNTTDANAKSVLYNNIFNIINREDPVPRVAPSAFSFVRYGKDCYLPSVETDATTYYTLIEDVKTQYKAATGKDYDTVNEAFSFYEINISIKDRTLTKENPTISKGVYIDNLINFVAQGIGSRETYVNNGVQSALVALGTYTKGDFSKLGDLFIQAFNEANDEYFTLWRLLTLSPATVLANIKPYFSTVLYKAFDENGLTKSEADSLTDVLFDDVLTALIAHLNYLVTTLKNGGNLFDAHYTEVTLAWMLAIDGDFKNEGEALSNILSGGDSYRVATINCPVNVSVYDSEGNLRVSVVDKEVKTDGVINPLCAYIDDAGQIVICIPENEEFSIEIIGTDDGTVSFAVAEYNFEEAQNVQRINYYDIPIEKGAVLNSEIAAKAENAIADEIKLYDSENEIEASEITDYETAEKFNVKVKSDNTDITVYGSGEFTSGEFTKATAAIAAGYEFRGWYINGKLVSSEPEYKFRVEKDTEITAKIKVTGFAKGDVDNDGELSASDARTVLRLSVGLESYTKNSPQYVTADVDRDSEVTASDARTVLRASVGLEDLSEK